MTSQRELAFFMASVYFETDNYQEMINELKRIIKIDPILNIDEINNLSLYYSSFYFILNSSINQITSIIEKEMSHGNKIHVEYLNCYKNKLLNESEKHLNEIITIIDDQLLPFTNDEGKILLYENMKTQYYYYLCRDSKKHGIVKYASKANKCFEEALIYVNKKLTPEQKMYQHFYFRYTNFLYEIMGEKKEALNIAKNVFDKCVNACDELDEQQTSSLFDIYDNINLWTHDINHNED